MHDHLIVKNRVRDLDRVSVIYRSDGLRDSSREVFIVPVDSL